MLKIFSLLLLGVVLASSSSILVRWTGDVPFTVIAFYRLAISTIVLLLYYLINPKTKIKSLRKFHWHFLLAGFFLAGHFVSFFASLQMTTIANSVFLETTHPIFAIIVSAIFLKEFPSKSTIPSFAIALIGMFLIVSVNTYSDSGNSNLIGDLLAVLSAILFSFYLLIARFHKEEPDLIKYLIYVYGSSALVCGVYLIIRGENFSGYTSFSWLMMLLLALIPHLFGHSLLNWASRHLEIFKVNLSLLLEPVIATLCGIILFFEYPSANFYAGAFLILLSLGLLITQNPNR